MRKTISTLAGLSVITALTLTGCSNTPDEATSGMDTAQSNTTTIENTETETEDVYTLKIEVNGDYNNITADTYPEDTGTLTLVDKNGVTINTNTSKTYVWINQTVDPGEYYLESSSPLDFVSVSSGSGTDCSIIVDDEPVTEKYVADGYAYCTWNSNN